MKTCPRSGSAHSWNLVDGKKIDRAVERHQFDRAHKIGGVRRQDLFFAGDQSDCARASELDDSVIVFAGEEPQRKPDHAAAMAEHALDGEMGLAGIGRPEDRDEPRSGAEHGHAAKVSGGTAANASAKRPTTCAPATLRLPPIRDRRAAARGLARGRICATYPRRVRANSQRQAMTQETRSFQAEVSRLLEIVAHSLYSEKEIFLRELISNASDACDRLRYAALTEPALAEGEADYRVVLTPDKSSRTLTVADNGIGMNRDELIENLGTIARSGTAAFMSQLSGDARKDMSLIGQFGVGFYSAFMVADKVEVLEPQGRRERGLALGFGRQRASSRSSRPDAARGAAITCICARATTNISTRTAARDRQDLFRPYRVADRAGGRQQGRDDQHRLGAVDPAARRNHPRAVQGILSSCRARLRRSVADLARPGRGRARIHEPAVRAFDKAVRPVRPGAQEPGQALCPPGLHHRRGHRAVAALSAVSCAASSTARICRSTSAARCCNRTRWWRASASS